MTEFNPEIQVQKWHYFSTKPMPKWPWINKMHQINDILATNPQTVLNIWVWDGIIDHYLRNVWLNITTMDIDPNLNPDVVGWLPDMPEQITNQKFDTILCAHVLEHLPFENFEKCIQNFSKISKYVVLQLPPSVFQIRFGLAMKPFLFDWTFAINLPLLFWKEYKFNWQHYWQLCRKNHPMSEVKKIIKKYFDIQKAYQCPDYHYSYNFILKNKNAI